MVTFNERIHQIASFVQVHLNEMALKYPTHEHDLAYRWEHTLRVTQYGHTIAKAEGANVEQVVVACLLHDVAHFESDDDYQSHGRRGAQVSIPLLKEMGYSPAQVDDITYSIAVHVDGDAGYQHEATLGAKVVSDADNIDRFGTYRILQWCVPEMDEFDKLCEKLSKRIQRLEQYRERNPLETSTGRALFDRQLERQIAFFNDLIGEHRLTVLLEI